MKCRVVGKSISSFVSRTTGEIIDNSKLYVIAPFPKNVYGDTEIFGERALEVRVPQEIVDPLDIGETVFMSFDDKGKFDDLERLNPPEPPKPEKTDTDKKK